VLVGGLLASGAIHISSTKMVLNIQYGLQGEQTSEEEARRTLRTPAGFHVSLFAHVPGARFLRFTPAGDLLVSRSHDGEIILLRANGTATATSRTVIADLNRPHGMEFHAGWLYVAERDRVGRIQFDAERGQTHGAYQPVLTGLTGNGNHWSKTLRMGPDGLFYLAQGSTCNVCEEADPRRATIMRFRADGTEPEIYATGLRNSIGFDWAPWSGELYATDNGRDLLGDDFPPCELNLVQQDSFYGWPYFNGANIPDPTMGTDPLAETREPIPPVHEFRAHNAPIGISFFDSDAPPEFRRAALVALHGSWNRSEPDGYKVVSLHWSADRIEERDFLTGFIENGDIRGRPVDVAHGPDGAIYVSDDYAGAVYKIHRSPSAGTPPAFADADEKARLDQAPPDWLIESDIPTRYSRGAVLYQNHGCPSCHELGESPVLLAKLNDRLGYAAVLEVFQAPQPPMPVYPLNMQQQQDLAVFLLNR